MIAVGQRKWRGLRWVVSALCLLSFLLSGAWPQPAGVQAVMAQTGPTVPMLFSSAPDVPDYDLQQIVEGVVGDLPGTWGVAIKKLDTGQYAAFNGDKKQVSASLYKTWVLNELFRQAKAGTVALSDYATVDGTDTYEDSLTGGASFSPGDSITLSRAAFEMITVSDNTCAHLLVRLLDPDNINRFMQRKGLFHSLLDWYSGGDNLTTPIDMLHEMEMIATSQMVDADSSRQMAQLLAQQVKNDIISPGLPSGVPFAHKTGWLDGMMHDAGIVYSPAGPFVIVVMGSNLDSYQTIYDNVPALARRVYKYLSIEPVNPARYFPETRQVVGYDFLKFWQNFGALDAFGYPIGPEQVQNGKLVQQFERARFEWNPANAAAGGIYPDVVLGPIGTERAAQLGLSWPRSVDTGAGKYFTPAGQGVTGDFYQYWLDHGGERVLGQPISPATNMINPLDGKSYYTQWFERARIELHPEAPADHQIVLGALGREMLAAPGH
ncbi:MAG: class A beta-lactamase-related serine hydrolase [Chloroflexota bacterium]|nr:class A beta-lactamase-related serine hydrolase [Chloroflexota bacterium]